MIEVRSAREDDVAAIGDVFRATYADHYCYPQFYDHEQLKKLVFTDDAELLVAEETETGRIVGTASVILHIGAFADLVGEFGRLAVHPEARHQGIAARLMEERIARVEERLHVGIVENRVAHPYSQKLSISHGFVPVGFLPLKLRLADRESVAVYARYFGDSLRFRRNHPRVIPEIHPLADLSLEACGIGGDVIVDEEAAPYPVDGDYELSEMTADGYATLLRFQRGRVQRREIFGPLRLHYGLFKMRATHAHYLIARRESRLVGAVGFTVDEVEGTVRIFELISTTDGPIRFLLAEVERQCRQRAGIEYLEIDVNADAARMQRTLVELGFVPAAYLPALVFHEVERLDTVKMVRLLTAHEFGTPALAEATKPVAELVLAGFSRRRIAPQIAEAAQRVGIFAGLSGEQADELARVCTIEQVGENETVYRAGEASGAIYLVLAGTIAIHVGDNQKKVGEVQPGECLGELSLLKSSPHTATAQAGAAAELARLTRDDLTGLARRRPDIGVIIYRNLAAGLGDKLHRSDEQISFGD